jgi:hypothetical protein
MATAGSGLRLISSVDISPAIALPAVQPAADANATVAELLRQLLVLQREQLELMREMATANREAKERRQAELERWQADNQLVVKQCRRALPVLQKAHAALLAEMADFAEENESSLVDADFLLSEFVDRFGPRLSQLTGVIALVRQVTEANANGG